MGTYSVRILTDENINEIRYASWQVISKPDEIQGIGMDKYLFDKPDARKLIMHLLLNYPWDQKMGWVSMHLCRHSKWSPYPAMEVIESFKVNGDMT